MKYENIILGEGYIGAVSYGIFEKSGVTRIFVQSLKQIVRVAATQKRVARDTDIGIVYY